MRWLRSLLGQLIRKVARSSFIRNLRNDVQPMTPLGTFTDSNGREFLRLGGYRDRAVPAWRRMFDPSPQPPVATQSQVARAREEVAALDRFLGLYGLSIVDKDVLEVGCYGGAHAYALVELGAKHVDAIDIPAYGVRQSPGKEMTPQVLAEQSRWLQQLRESTASLCEDDSLSGEREGQIYRFEHNRVVFFDLDIVELEQTSAYDVIVSWYTLEHVTDPPRALANMYRALRPGGVCFHDYNPFFCVNGAHSLCTLDFPYGHVRLSSADFERYIRTFRPQEFGVAMNFYCQSLNRMTLADLQRYCIAAGFEFLALIEWHNKDDFLDVDQIILSQCETLYPTVTVSDLISRSVWVLLRKPT